MRIIVIISNTLIKMFLGDTCVLQDKHDKRFWEFTPGKHDHFEMREAKLIFRSFKKLYTSAVRNIILRTLSF